MVDGKTSVVARMPVLCGNDEFEDGGFQEAVGDRDDPISLRDGKSAAGTKVVLEVNQDEGAQICDYLVCGGLRGADAVSFSRRARYSSSSPSSR